MKRSDTPSDPLTDRRLYIVHGPYEREGKAAESRRPGCRGVAPVLLALLLAALIGQCASGAQCLITVNTSDSDQWNPDISGHWIVWEDATTGAVHLYDLSTGADTPVSPSASPQYHPTVSGDLAAWEEMNPSFSLDIRYRNLLTDATGVLSMNGATPVADGQRIAWAEGSPAAALSLYDETSGTTATVVTSGDDASFEHPSLSGSRIVWVNGSETTILLKDTGSGNELQVASGSSFWATPRISGDRVVWQDKRDGPWEIYLLDLASPPETPLTTDAVDQQNPAIDDTRVVWRNGSEIYLLDLAGSAPATPLSSGGVNDLPRISGDLVAWQKYDLASGGYYDIYLANLSPSAAGCPVADFEADVVDGLSPLTVHFTDLSAGAGHRLWEFGDGTTSTERNPVHTYSSDGSYSVALTVGNPDGRDYLSKPGYIVAGSIPHVTFSADQTYGLAPLLVKFTNATSRWPTDLAWDFGDGSPVTHEPNPVHTYLAPGTYAVSLAGTNTYGTGTVTMAEPVRALNGANLVSVTNLAGLTVLSVDGRQEIALGPAAVVTDNLSPGSPPSFSFVPQASSGWQRMTFSSSDGFGFARDAGGIIRGNLSSCTLESRELVPGTFTTGVGNNLPVSYRLDLPTYPPDAAINFTVWEGVMPDDDAAFRDALLDTSPDFSSVLATAYTLSFVPERLGPVTGASLNLSVSAAWIQANGNENNIAVIRIGDDGTRETLNPASTFADAAGTPEYFTIPSPRGLSRFALVSAAGSSNLLQMGSRLATQLIQGGGGQTGSSGSPPSAKDRAAWEQPQPAGTAAAERPAATYYGEGKLDTTVAGLTRDPVVIQSRDHGAGLAIRAGTLVLDNSGQPLTLVSADPVSAGAVPPVTGDASIFFTGLAYDFGPDGATFNPPATISFTVPDSQWSPDTGYSIRTYAEQAGSWEDVPTSVDPATRTASGQVSHLCIFGLFAVPAAGPQAQAAGAPAATPATVAKPVPRTPMGTFTGLIGWIYATATGHLAVSLTILLGGIVSLYAWSRREWLGRYRPWVTLYLASLSGVLWAFFLLASGGRSWEPVFLLTTIAGLNLIVHILRFDRIDLTRSAWRRYRPAPRRW
ncbi:MAG TPA: PKD domain-containing protein [Methanomicrobiales archaeon]|nr:PKD domain-containing protein [Methanomicrobiales archaeon]